MSPALSKCNGSIASSLSYELKVLYKHGRYFLQYFFKSLLRVRFCKRSVVKHKIWHCSCGFLPVNSTSSSSRVYSLGTENPAIACRQQSVFSFCHPGSYPCPGRHPSQGVESSPKRDDARVIDWAIKLDWTVLVSGQSE